MSLPPPNLGSNVNPRLREYLRILGESYNELEGRYKQLAIKIESVPDNLTNLEGGSDSTDLGARGRDPLLVEQLPGQLAQPQIPFAPVVDILPDLGDPQSQNGSLVIFNNMLYQFDGRVSPGTWNPIMGSGGTVLSVGLVAPAEFIVSGSPVTVSGNISLVSRNSNNISTITKQGNTTADQELMTYSLPANILALGAQCIRVTANGLYSTEAGQTPTITIKIKLTSPAPTTVTVLTITTAATTAASTNSQWRLISEISAASLGTTGTLLVKGRLIINLVNNPANLTTTYLDLNTVASGAIDLTSIEILSVTASFSTQPGAVFNRISQEELLVEYIN